MIITKTGDLADFGEGGKVNLVQIWIGAKSEDGLSSSPENLPGRKRMAAGGTLAALGVAGGGGAARLWRGAMAAGRRGALGRQRRWRPHGRWTDGR